MRSDTSPFWVAIRQDCGVMLLFRGEEEMPGVLGITVHDHVSEIASVSVTFALGPDSPYSVKNQECPIGPHHVVYYKGEQLPEQKGCTLESMPLRVTVDLFLGAKYVEPQ